ncbi:profilin-4 isoform X3 [Loxodonta africana]|uniref:profilin-4 isoform X3 n=1 Tax=Loxodonta africana TaxID=9785 RepID=UPI000C81139F|nr:profilin-4 isoform X3 [Loxodonta africana]
MSHLQTLLLDTLLGTKHVDSAALIKLQERSLCVASPGFNVMPSDVRTLVNGFAKNPLQTRREGLYFREKDYKCVRADDYSLYAKNENIYEKKEAKSSDSYERQPLLFQKKTIEPK